MIRLAVGAPRPRRKRSVSTHPGFPSFPRVLRSPRQAASMVAPAGGEGREYLNALGRVVKRVRRG